MEFGDGTTMKKIMNMVFTEMKKDKSKFTGAIIDSTLAVLVSNKKDYDSDEVHEFSPTVSIFREMKKDKVNSPEQ